MTARLRPPKESGQAYGYGLAPALPVCLPVSVFRVCKPGLALLLSLAIRAAADPPAPPPPRPPASVAAGRIPEIRRKLDATKPVDVTAQRAVQYSREFLATAEEALRVDQPFLADRMAGAADALLHVAEHQQHLRLGGGAKPPPPVEEMRDRLQRVYFRTQQADYFLSQAHEGQAAAFPKWARDFYQLARRAYDRKDLLAADENAKCAEEVVNALENLAQAAAPADLPPRRPKPPLP